MSRRHILIVDDDRELTSFLTEILCQCDGGYRVTVSHSGEEALEKLEAMSVDVLVTDLRMPGLDGLALIRWARTFHPDTPAILMTGDAHRDVPEQARACGAWKTVLKSLHLPARLGQAIGDALAARDAEERGQSGTPTALAAEG